MGGYRPKSPTAIRPAILLTARFEDQDMKQLLVASLFLNVGCRGIWPPQLSGGQLAEDGITPEDLDGEDCTVDFEYFVITIHDAILLDQKSGERAGGLDNPKIFDLALPGPHLLEAMGADRGRYDSFTISYEVDGLAKSANTTVDWARRFTADGLSMHVQGFWTCDGEEKDFYLTLNTSAELECVKDQFRVNNSDDEPALVYIRPERLFTTALGDPDAPISIYPFWNADRGDDANGSVTWGDLSVRGFSDLGFDKGPFEDIYDLEGWVRAAALGILSVEGGECTIL
jgi:hypothetical protein